MIGRGRSGLWDIVELLSGMTGRTVGERTGCEASTGPGLVHPQQSTEARPPTMILRLYLESDFVVPIGGSPRIPVGCFPRLG